MAITAETYWEMRCDRCGEHALEGMEGGYELGETEADARQRVEDSDGRLEDDGTVICQGCVDEENPPKGTPEQ